MIKDITIIKKGTGLLVTSLSCFLHTLPLAVKDCIFERRLLKLFLVVIQL